MRYIALILLAACSSADPQPSKKIELATVTTELVTVNTSGIVVKNTITDDGGSPIVSRGFCYGGLTPDLAGPHSEGETDTLVLPRDEIHRIRAYVRNGVGISYGNLLTVFNVCESSLGGVISYLTTNITTMGDPCGAVSGQTNFSEISEGFYNIGDASFGVYACAWGDSPAKGVSLVDVCGEWSIRGFDQYGLEYSWTVVSNNGTELVIDWSNDFGDSGRTTLTRSGGWPL